MGETPLLRRIRESVIGLDDRKATEEELQRMRAVLARGIEEGAWGLSTGLIYPPCCYCDARELVSLGAVASVKSVPIVVHMRSESDRIVQALDEMLEVGKRASVAIHISHFKIAGQNNWPKLQDMISRVERALQSGAVEVRLTAATALQLARDQRATLGAGGDVDHAEVLGIRSRSSRRSRRSCWPAGSRSGSPRRGGRPCSRG